MSYANASYLIMLVNGAGLPARILLPIVADRIGPLNIIASCCVGFAIILSTWFGVSHVAGLYVFTTFLGMASGATQSLMPTTVASITKRLDTVGTRLGMCFSVCSFASLTGPPIGGALQSAGDYTHAQIWAVVSAIAGAALLVSARIFKVGWVKAKC
jgi:MFS family permease